MTSHRIGRTTLLALIAVVAAMAFGAGTASAEEAEATWQQSTSTMRWQGALTVDAASAAPKSCSSLTVNGWAVPGSENWAVVNSSYGSYGPVLKLSCASSTQLLIKLDPEGVGASPYAWYDTETGGYMVCGVFESGLQLPSPYGQYMQEYFCAPFINAGEGGSATSKIVFNETQIGVSIYGALTLTGTITVDDGKGKPRTLTH